MSKANCAMCGYELTVPNEVDVPEDCDVVCGDCGESLEKYLAERRPDGDGATLH